MILRGAVRCQLMAPPNSVALSLPCGTGANKVTAREADVAQQAIIESEQLGVGAMAAGAVAQVRYKAHIDHARLWMDTRAERAAKSAASAAARRSQASSSGISSAHVSCLRAGRKKAARKVFIADLQRFTGLRPSGLAGFYGRRFECPLNGSVR
jgi:hypothetical protein